MHLSKKHVHAVVVELLEKKLGEFISHEAAPQKSTIRNIQKDKKRNGVFVRGVALKKRTIDVIIHSVSNARQLPQLSVQKNVVSKTRC